MAFPASVKIVEVGPRDGLQNEKVEIATADKLELIDRLVKSGLKCVEATSFVSPKWVPQMADHAEIMNALKGREDANFPALVPNMKGMEGAIECGVREVAVFAAASESFSQKNINCSIKESLERFAPVFEAAQQHDIKVRAYVSCIAGCPYEGDIAPSVVGSVSRALKDMGAYEISLGDTIGVGTPSKIQKVIEAVEQHGVDISEIALHAHDTYGQALANIYAALQMGVSVIDASVAGLGGCPYAKGASGNVASEDVVYMLQGEGIETGVNLHNLIDAAWFISNKLGRKPNSKVANAIQK
jgi:hydroxymethylglutaryl-CoA lyase